MTKILLALAPLMILTVPATTHAAGSVTVHLQATLFQTASLATCDVAVADGADGAAVLDAAVAQGCILSWSGTTFAGIGTFVDCIDQICGETATYWEMFENGISTSYGIDGFSAQDGDTLGFDYTEWVVALP